MDAILRSLRLAATAGKWVRYLELLRYAVLAASLISALFALLQTVRTVQNLRQG